MLEKLYYYLLKLDLFCKKNFSFNRIKKFGIIIPSLRFVVFLGHRKNILFFRLLERLHDEKVNKYLLKKYEYVFNKYFE